MVKARQSGTVVYLSEKGLLTVENELEQKPPEHKKTRRPPRPHLGSELPSFSSAVHAVVKPTKR